MTKGQKPSQDWKTSAEVRRRIAEAARNNPDPRTLKPKKELTLQQKRNIEKAIRGAIEYKNPDFFKKENLAQKVFRTMGKVPALTAASMFFGSTPTGDATRHGTNKNYKINMYK